MKFKTLIDPYMHQGYIKGRSIDNLILNLIK